MCNHQDTVIVNGVQTCRSCGAWRTVDSLNGRPKSEWQFGEELDQIERVAADTKAIERQDLRFKTKILNGINALKPLEDYLCSGRGRMVEDSGSVTPEGVRCPVCDQMVAVNAEGVILRHFFSRDLYRDDADELWR
jgi:hypothetical protein